MIVLGYDDNKNPITDEELMTALKNLEIEQGDTICVSTEITSFGRPALKKNDYLRTIGECLIKAVGEDGTVLMPAFTYSYCDNSEYDVENTPTKMGALNEFFRKMPGVSRTDDPLFSFGIIGKNKDLYMECGQDCFGEDSVYGILHKNKGKLVLLGSRLKAYTILIYMEQMVGVPHRYKKKFSGITIKQGNRIENTYEYYVRDYNSEHSILSEPKIVSFLEEKECFKEVPFVNGSIVAIDVEGMYKEVTDKLKEDSIYFLY